MRDIDISNSRWMSVFHQNVNKRRQEEGEILSLESVSKKKYTLVIGQNTFIEKRWLWCELSKVQEHHSIWKEQRLPLWNKSNNIFFTFYTLFGIFKIPIHISFGALFPNSFLAPSYMKKKHFAQTSQVTSLLLLLSPVLTKQV